MKSTIEQLLKKKGNQIISISPEKSVYDAIDLLSEKRIGALLVMQGESLQGIITERDYARKVILQGKSSKETKVQEIMTGKVIFIAKHNTVEQAMAVMTEKKIRHLPVMEGSKCVGIVSIGDLVSQIISDRQFMIDQLIKYVSSDYM